MDKQVLMVMEETGEGKDHREILARKVWVVTLDLPDPLAHQENREELLLNQSSLLVQSRDLPATPTTEARTRLNQTTTTLR